MVDNCIVLPKSSYDWCGGEYTFTGIYMDIPVYMMSYLLNIRSVRDFSAFMDAFDGLFGLNIGKLVKGVDEVRWFEVEYWR